MGHRIIMMGYGLIGQAALDWLNDRGLGPVAIITHSQGDDRWQGPLKGMAVNRSAGQEGAPSSGVPLFIDPPWEEPAFRQQLADLHPDLFLSVWLRDMVPPAVLGLARCGGVNLHGSLLPRYRGRAPVNWMVLHGETEGGITLHQMTRRADAGRILATQRFPIGAQETAFDVLLKVRAGVGSILAQALPDYLEGRLIPRSQEGVASVFGRRGPQDGRLDWNQPCDRVLNLIRAVTRPFPGAWLLVPRRDVPATWAPAWAPAWTPEWQRRAQSAQTWREEPLARLTIWWARPCASTIAPGRIDWSGRHPLLGCADGSLELVDFSLLPA